MTTSNPSVTLFGRACRITAGNVAVERIGQELGLDVWFQVRRSLKPGDPNTADLKLYNLSRDTLQSLAKSSQKIPAIAQAPGAPASVTPVKIEAGYVGNMSTLFLGEMRSAQTVREKDDFVTELQTGDGDAAQQLRANVSLPPGTNAYNVAVQLLGVMQKGQGNLATVADALRASTMYQQGAVVKGNAFDLLVSLCRSNGLECSIQNGKPQFLSLGQPVAGQAYKLSSDSGLIGEPSVDTKGVLSCMTLMLPGLRPGMPIVMDSEFVQGTYRIVSIETTGDTNGDDWSHKIEAWAPGTGIV